MILSLAGCKSEDTAETMQNETTETTAFVYETEEIEERYPLTVIDQAGREVVIEKEPQRLISAYYITTSLLMALDLDEQMVGIENTPEKRAVYGLSAPKLLELPTVGTAKELDIEACLALEPDLMILPMKLKSTVEVLEEFDIDVLLVDPEDQERLIAMIELVALAANREEQAQQVLAFIQEQQEFLNESLADTERPSVYLAGNSSMLKTAGDAMYQSNMIRLAGGMNAASGIEDTYWAEIDYEQLLSWDPEYIILAAEAVYTGRPESEGMHCCREWQCLSSSEQG